MHERPVPGPNGSHPPTAASAVLDPPARQVSLSVVMPVYNEARTIVTAVRQVLGVDYPTPMELIVVDDGSDDGTPLELALVSDGRMRVHRHPTNLGKGAAVRTGISLATGTHVMPFDADLEYSPEDVPRMLAPIQAGRCDVVYGTRLFGLNTVYQSYRYAMGNRITTLAANVLFDSYLSDLHTCLKLLPRDLIMRLSLRELGFGLDTEITASLLRRGVRPFEVPVSYHSRTREQGKKLSWRDGVECLRILGRVRFARSARPAVVALEVAAQASEGSRTTEAAWLPAFAPRPGDESAPHVG